MKTVHVTAEVKIPDPPNFFHQENGDTLPIEAVAEDDLTQIGAEWTKELLRKAKAKRAKEKKQ